MTTELANCDRVGLAVQANVVHNFFAAIDAVLDICVEVVAYLFVVGKVIQGDLGEGQKAGDFLRRRQGKDNSVTLAKVYFGSHLLKLLIANYPILTISVLSIMLSFSTCD